MYYIHIFFHISLVLLLPDNKGKLFVCYVSSTVTAGIWRRHGTAGENGQWTICNINIGRGEGKKEDGEG